jgi:hypothetical protein
MLEYKTEIRFKYQTNFLEKTLLSTGETIKEPYGTLTIETVKQLTDGAAKKGKTSLINAYVDLDPDEKVTRIVQIGET